MLTECSIKPLSIATAALMTALIAGLLLGSGGSDNAKPRQAAEAAEAAEAAQPALRTVAVYTDAEPEPSANSEQMRGLLIEGDLSKGEFEATVLTDEDCDPDQAGVSHCRNQLKLPNGDKITIRHPHRMNEVPCLAPDERVIVSFAAGQSGAPQ